MTISFGAEVLALDRVRGVALAKTDYKSVAQYLAAQPDTSRPVLERVRAIILKALPEADEVISYQIPAYKQDGATVLFFAGWKEHYSLYPTNQALVAAFGASSSRTR